MSKNINSHNRRRGTHDNGRRCVGDGGQSASSARRHEIGKYFQYNNLLPSIKYRDIALSI
jgi:hypothetical protein